MSKFSNRNEDWEIVMAELKQAEQLGDRTVLVVEDDMNVGSLLVSIIEEELLYRVLLAANAYEALAIVENTKPHLFILDYQLPGMNGLQLYDHLHVLPGLEQVPGLVISANAPVNEIKKRHLWYLKKPFELNELLDITERLANQGRDHLQEV
jgi:CheY-like chemotaxis protein